MNQKKAYSPAVAKAQQKYGAGLRQFKVSLSKTKDADYIRLLEAIPNFKHWILNQLTREQNMKVKVVKVPDGRRLIKGRYVDFLDLDYTQDLADLQKDIELALPVLLENLSVIDNMTTSGNILVYRGNSHIDIVKDQKGSLGWLTINHIIDFEEMKEA